MSDVGGGRHLKMRASRDGRTVDMIFFSVTRAKSGLAVGDKADVAFYPQINEYRGSRTVQLHLVDLRPAYSPDQLDDFALYERFRSGGAVTAKEAGDMIPTRDEFAGLWRYLAGRNGEIVDTPARLARRVAHEADLWESPLRTLICLDVMEELDLLKVTQEEGGALRVKLRKRRGKGKVNLFDAPLIQHLQSLSWSGGEKKTNASF
jgi:single-stranded-DNA-specific exonuclease